MAMRSELPLHLPPLDTDEWDVDVRWGFDIDDTESLPDGDVIAELWEGERRLYTAVETDDSFVIRFPEVGEFVISRDVDTVELRRDRSGAFAHLVPILMEGTVPAMLHGLRGEATLHASAVASNGRALAFVGESGRGKSTLAAVLCVLGGAALVTDDVLVVRADDTATCVGGATELRLRQRAASIATERDDLGARTTADDRTALAPPALATGWLPLAAIVVPTPSRDAVHVELEEVGPLAGLLAMLAFPRVAGWTRPDVLAKNFETLGRVAQSVPVYRATIPWGPPFRPGVATSLLDLTSPKN